MKQKSSVEVLPFDKAPWAPDAGGCKFRWAWRVRDARGETVTRGASNRTSKRQVEAEAKAYTDRTYTLGTGGASKSVWRPGPKKRTAGKPVHTDMVGEVAGA